MKTKLIEATNGQNFGKFMLGVFDEADWAYESRVLGHGLLRSIGQGQGDVLVFDLQTCEGAIFKPGGSVKHDLDKHRIWVCPMYHFFLEWLYAQPKEKVAALDLPALVTLDTSFFAFAGYRRPGPRLVSIEPDVLGPDSAELYARKILARVAEIREMPPEGWERCTKPPAPGTVVRYFANRSSKDGMEGTVLDEKRATSEADRVVVRWSDGKVGEPSYESLITKG